MHDPVVTDMRITNLEEAVDDIRQAVRSIDESLQVLARLEERHSEAGKSISRAFTEIQDHETRLRDLEKDAPTMRMVRGWIVTWVVGIVGLVGAALIGLVLGGGVSVPGALP